MTAQETDEQLAAHFLAVLRQRSIAAREWERQADQWKASADEHRTQREAAERRTDEMVEQVKQIANDACQSVYLEWRAGAEFENMPLAIAARMTLGFMSLREVGDE